MMSSGWIKLNREITKHWIWEDAERLKAWVDLIMLAENTTHKKIWRGKLTEFKRGDVCLSITELSNRWGWSRNRVRRFLRTLEDEEMISLHVTVNRTTLTLVNYGKYQDKPTLNGTVKRAVNKSVNKPVNGTVDDTSDGPSDGPYLKNNKNIYKESKEEAAPISSEVEEPERWNGKLIKDLTDEEWVEYLNSWED